MLVDAYDLTKSRSATRRRSISKTFSHTVLTSDPVPGSIFDSCLPNTQPTNSTTENVIHAKFPPGSVGIIPLELRHCLPEAVKRTCVLTSAQTAARRWFEVTLTGCTYRI